MGISRDDWLNALRDVSGPVDPDALTVQEFAELLGISPATAWRKMTTLVNSGKAVRTQKEIRRRDQRPILVPAYRLT